MKISIKLIPDTNDDCLAVNLVLETGDTDRLANINYDVSEVIIDVDKNTVLELVAYSLQAGETPDYINNAVNSVNGEVFELSEDLKPLIEESTDNLTIDSDTQKVETDTTS